MKILLISNGYPPQRWAGTETYTAGIAEELWRRGVSVQVLCDGEWDTDPHYWNGDEDHLYHNVPLRRLNLNWQKAPDSSAYLYNNPIIGAYLSDYLKKIQPDIVHVTSCETLSASILQVLHQTGIPTVLSLTDFWFLCPRYSLLRSDGSNCNGITSPWDCLSCCLGESNIYRWSRQFFSEEKLSKPLLFMSKKPFFTGRRGLRGMACNMAERKLYLSQALGWPDVRITDSHFVRDVFLANGVKSPIIVQPYGHDLTWLKQYQGKKPSHLLRIGFIGQLIPSKAPHLLLQAASDLQKDFPDRCQFLLYGNLDKNPQYREQLQALASSLKNVEFCGTYSHDQSAEIYANLDLLIVPSSWYDFPLVIHEAFATHTPVIATNIGSIAENVKHTTNGLLFERNDVGDLCRQLIRVITEPSLLKHLQDGIKPVKTIACEVDELYEIYTGLVRHQIPVSPSLGVTSPS